MTARPLWPSLVALVVCVGVAGGSRGQITVARAASDPPPASIDWRADAERPWQEEWSTFSCESDKRFAHVNAPVAQGAWAYGFELRDGDDSYGERCELSQGNPTRPGFPVFEEDEERWISWQIYLPNDYPLETTRWSVVNQWKQRGDLGTPALSMQARAGQFQLKHSNSNRHSCCTVTRWSGPAKRNRWVRFTLHVKFSPDKSVGFIELFGDLDGSGQRLLLPKLSTHTMKRDGDGDAVRSHGRIGPYRDPDIDGTTHVYYDDYVVSTAAPMDLWSPGSLGAERSIGGPVVRVARPSRRLKRRRTHLSITCHSPIAGAVTGKVSLTTAHRVSWRGRRRKVRLGSATFQCKPNRSTVVPVRVPLRVIRGVKRVRVSGKVVVQDAAGGAADARTTFTLVAPR